MGKHHQKHHKSRERLTRKQKLYIHGVLLAAIAIALGIEGAKHADWLFLGLAALVEVA